MRRTPLLTATVLGLGFTCHAVVAYGQSQTRYAPPNAGRTATPAPSPAPSSDAGRPSGSTYTGNGPQFSAPPSLNSIALEQARARSATSQPSSPGSFSSGAGSIGLGRGRSVSAKPFSSYSASPALSPYLNLFRDGLGEGDEVNYQTIVRPQLQQQRFNQQVERQNLELSRRLQAISARGAFSNPAGAEKQIPTGHRTFFGFHSHYYPAATPRRQR